MSSATDRQRAAFFDVSRRLGAARTPEAAARIIVGVAQELLGWDACSLDLYFPATHRVQAVLSMDTVDGVPADVPHAYTATTPGPMTDRVLQEGAQLVLRPEPGPTAHGLVPFGTGRPSLSLMFVPVRHGGGHGGRALDPELHAAGLRRGRPGHPAGAGRPLRRRHRAAPDRGCAARERGAARPGRGVRARHDRAPRAGRAMAQGSADPVPAAGGERAGSARQLDRGAAAPGGRGARAARARAPAARPGPERRPRGAVGHAGRRGALDVPQRLHGARHGRAAALPAGLPARHHRAQEPRVAAGAGPEDGGGGAARRRHRARLQQPADRDSGKHRAAALRDRASPILGARTSRRSGAPRIAPPAWCASCWPTAGSR